MPRKKAKKPIEKKAAKRYLTGLDPLQEWRVQQRLNGIMQRKFRREFAAEIHATTRAMLDSFALTGSAPNADPAHVSRLTDIYTSLAKMAVDLYGGRILDQGKRLGYPLETKSFQETFLRLALEWIVQEAIRQRITRVSETTRAWIIARIAEGQKAGESIEEIAKAIAKEIPTISRYRGALIARTETHAAANYAANEAAKATGLKMKKEWVAVEDSRTRDFGEGDGKIDEYNHRAMDGQTVEMDQPFKMPHKLGTPLEIMYPGEAGKPGGAVINCRCGVAHVVDDSQFGIEEDDA